jgi:hypothetical protein
MSRTYGKAVRGLLVASCPYHECVSFFVSGLSEALSTDLKHFQGSSNSTIDTSQQLQYNYVPTEWVAITFISLFGISTCMSAPFVSNGSLLIVELPQVVHIMQALRSRLWWLIPSVIFCGFLEVVGWSSRLWSSHNPFSFPPFVIQWVHFNGHPFVLLLIDVQSSNTCHCTHTASCGQFYSLRTHRPPARPTIQPSDT